MTITLPAELERKVEAAAAEGVETPEGLVNRILAEALGPVFVRPTEPPAWLEQVQPRTPPTDGTNGLNRWVGGPVRSPMRRSRRRWRG